MGDPTPASNFSVHELEVESDKVVVKFEANDGAAWKVQADWSGTAIFCSSADESDGTNGPNGD